MAKETNTAVTFDFLLTANGKLLDWAHHHGFPGAEPYAYLPSLLESLYPGTGAILNAWGCFISQDDAQPVRHYYSTEPDGSDLQLPAGARQLTPAGIVLLKDKAIPGYQAQPIYRFRLQRESILPVYAWSKCSNGTDLPQSSNWQNEGLVFYVLQKSPVLDNQPPPPVQPPPPDPIPFYRLWRQVETQDQG